MKEFRKQVTRYLQDSDRTVLAGISGGPDSMALLYLLNRHNVNTVVVHCNYQLRGKHSEQDQLMVEQFSSLWKMECISLRLDPGDAEGTNFQQWAREERYRIFRELKSETGASLILTAHHEDDQAETILQKILRGGGLSSWQAMKVWSGDLFRPLLNCKKGEIMQFLHEQSIPYKIDSSNEESTYARNFIRNTWFPEMNRLFPGWKENLLKIPHRAAEFSLLTDSVLDRILDDEFHLNREGFMELDNGLKPVILHRFVERLAPEADLSRGFLDRMEKLDKLQTGKSWTVSEQLNLLRDRGSFVLVSRTADPYDLYRITPEELKDGFLAGHIEMRTEQYQQKIEEGILQLDFDRLLFPLTLRRWEDGDAIRPLGMRGTQSVSDHLTNRKIPAVKKRDAFVLLSFDGTISAVIFPKLKSGPFSGTISETVRCTRKTRNILTIRTR